jgi:bifunctional DNA-binding transcriptional regulator/antitoxin component of YhaV-PrlF toxin-antitoxin module
MTDKSFITTIQEDPADPESAIITFPDEMMKELGWQEGDELTWTDNGDGSFSLTQPTEFVMVDCISTFHQRYLVEVPVGKKDWALDTVTCEEAREFSQKHIGETIVTHRVVSKEEALAEYDADSPWCKDWTDEMKIKAGFTLWKNRKHWERDNEE